MPLELMALGLGRGGRIYLSLVNLLLPLSCTRPLISPLYPRPSQTDWTLFLPSPTGRLEEYLGSMAKIQKAVEYFQDNSPDSPELNKVVRDQQSNARSLQVSVPVLNS